MPLYTPRWGGPPVVALVPHLFGGTAFQELAAPLAAAVWLAERPLGRVYRGVPFQAISESTADDLAERGIPRDAVEVIYPGIDTVGYTPCASERAPAPVFAYLGRLKRYKGVHQVIARLRGDGAPDGDVSRSPARATIARRSSSSPRRLTSASACGFLGASARTEKLRLLRRAWALVFASPKEGWGITNLEAAACGTPVVASNSPGIRESVRHGETGYLVPHGDVPAMAAAMSRIAGDRRARRAPRRAGARVRRDVHLGARRERDRAHLYRVLATRRTPR